MWDRSGPGTLEGVPAVGSRWAAEAPEAAPSPSLPPARGSPPPAGTCCAAAWLGRPPASSPPAPGEHDTSSLSLGRSPGTHPGSGFPPWTSPAAPVKKGRQTNWHELTGRRTKTGAPTAGNCSNKLRLVWRFLISSGMFIHEPQRQCFTYSRLNAADSKHSVPFGRACKPCDQSFSEYPGCEEMNVDFLYSKSYCGKGKKNLSPVWEVSVVVEWPWDLLRKCWIVLSYFSCLVHVHTSKRAGGLSSTSRASPGRHCYL